VVSSALTWISSSGSNSARDPLIASRMAAVRQPEKKREACRWWWFVYPPRDTSPHQDSAGTAPSGIPPPAQPPPPPQPPAHTDTGHTVSALETPVARLGAAWRHFSIHGELINRLENASCSPAWKKRKRVAALEIPVERFRRSFGLAPNLSIYLYLSIYIYMYE